MFSRRLFLKSSGLALFGVGSVPAWLSRAALAETVPGGRKKILITIFQRGAVDGLNVVIPHAEAGYYSARPSIAIARPNGTAEAAIDLDGRFGLHPALAGLKLLWDRQQLAIVEAVGSPDPTRSHFDAQDYMESGTPGRKATADGWLNRALFREQTPSPFRAVSLTTDVPRVLRGSHADTLAIRDIKDFQIRDASAAAAFEGMYGRSGDQVLNGAGREAFRAMSILQSLGQKRYLPANGAEYPNGRLGQSLKQIAGLIKADVGLEVAFTDVGGWDTHVNEVGLQTHTGQLANLLRDFGQALCAFSQDMGDRMADITLVTMSEFGRTVRENGDRGTDHGHANVMFVLGGNVRGGKVYGDWPGLGPEQLYEGRDLNVTTDFRTVLSECVAKQIGNAQVASVFPGFEPGRPLNLLRI